MGGMRDRLDASRLPLALIAVALCVSGALVLTFSAWEARGLIGWGLVLLGVVALIVGLVALAVGLLATVRARPAG